jgi:Leucine-rich repeat (LRR) protein
VDISFNMIKGIHSLESNDKLTYLDLYENKISSNSVVAQLSMECLALVELNLA